MKILRVLFVAIFAVGGFMTPPATAKPGEEIDRILQEFSRRKSNLDDTVQALVKSMAESPEDPGVPKAFAFLIHRGGVSEGSDYDMGEAFLRRLEKHHRDNDQLAAALIAMIGFREDETIAFYERLGEESESALVSGTALLALASSFEYDPDNIPRYEAALKKMIEKHPGLKYGRRDLTGYATQKLYASENLRVGDVAPEVEGEDVDGKKFKLSDYRGKVVFFNFWGDW